MTTRREKLLRLCEATDDEKKKFAYIQLKKHELETLGIDGHNLILGISFENQRLLPILTALIDTIEKYEAALGKCKHYTNKIGNEPTIVGTIVDEALAASPLDAILEKEK